jgi:beta-aspartyl-dipeptidase (metallo-type)
MVRDALERSEIPARVFNPTHVNRRKALFDEALALAELGCTVDITAFPETHSDDEWAAEEALLRYLDSGQSPRRVTMSSDGGGCLPVFDDQGNMLQSDVGRPSALSDVLLALLRAGQPPERVLPAFTRNVAELLRLHGKGRVAVGADADLVVLDRDWAIRDVMALGRWHVRDGRQMIFGQFEGGMP